MKNICRKFNPAGVGENGCHWPVGLHPRLFTFVPFGDIIAYPNTYQPHPHEAKKYFPFYAPEAGTPLFIEADMFLTLVPLKPHEARTGEIDEQVTPQVKAILARAKTPASRDELQEAAQMSDREHFRKSYLLPLLGRGWIERTVPDKPNSRLQRYVLTMEGRQVLGKKV